VEADPIPQQAEQTAEQTDNAHLVVGILAELDSEASAKMFDALRGLPGPLRVAVLQNNQPEIPGPANSETTPASAYVFPVASPLAKISGPTAGGPSMSAQYQSVFAVAEKLQARGCCIMASNLEAVTPQWAWQMAQPLLESDADLVLPHYARRKFEGLLNVGVIAPMMRALYGKRVNNPMGPDLGVSRRLFQKLLAPSSGTADGNRLHPLASLTPTALCQNLQIIEVHFGTRVYPPTDWTNMSSVLADVLTPVFLDVERNAPCWQRMRVSAAVPAIGTPFPLGKDTGALDTSRMVESFQLGNQELREIWGMVLPPSTLFELRKLSRLPQDQFRMPDELWVRIVYDFALAHRLRTISRDHLLKSMTPLYAGWVASYSHDLLLSGPTSPEQRLERLSLAYEAGKSYLVSRWRWPDRFYP
jgi:glucosylglycerate synthase